MFDFGESRLGFADPKKGKRHELQQTKSEADVNLVGVRPV